jgi:transposase InsO family protein
MAEKVTAMDVRMATALVGGVGNVSEFCARQAISRTTYYKWQARYLAEGLDGLQERSRRPQSCVLTTPTEVEELIVLLRKQLAGNGDYNGPETIREHLLADCVAGVPSRATIARILTRRGLVVPQPRKRPRSSYRPFVAARPNEMWQSDWTGWQLANGKAVAIAGTLDDHSRLIVGIGACHGDGTAQLVWSVMGSAIGCYGVPMCSLSDNGRVYSLARYAVAGQTAFEINLNALGCRVITSTPYHPQTCGKIERLWQTLKKWLRAHGPFATLSDLNAALLEFAEYYNTRRPHRALHGRTPAEVFAASTCARPAARPLPARLTMHQVHASTSGLVSAGPCQVMVGRAWAGLPMTVIKDGAHITIFTGNQLVRVLDADPPRGYQPLNRPPGTRPHAAEDRLTPVPAPDRRAPRRSAAGVKVEPRPGDRAAAHPDRNDLDTSEHWPQSRARSRHTTTQHAAPRRC